MKRYAIAAVAALALSGCAATVEKNFKVFADPADSEIRVVSGVELKELMFRSPATVAAQVPKDPELAKKTVVEVRRDNYEPVVVSLRDVKDGQTLNIKLEKAIRKLFRYRLTYRLAGPAKSDTLQFRDANISVSFTVSDKAFDMHFTNLGNTSLKILWERAQYTDANRQAHRLMHTGIRFQDRNNPLPDQVVPPRAEVLQGVIPVSKVFFSRQKKEYEVQTLFPLYSDAAAQLRGKTVNLFIPIEVDRAIIPYNFKIEIIDAVKEPVKG